MSSAPVTVCDQIHPRKRKRVEESGARVSKVDRKFVWRTQGPLEIWYFYHLGVTVTVGAGAGSWGRQGGGQRAGVCGDVVFVVVVRLGGPLRVTAGQEVGARPGHSGFLFGAGAAHLLPGNHSNKINTLYRRACVMQLMTGHISNGERFSFYEVKTQTELRACRWYVEDSCMLTFLTSLFLDPADLESSLCIERERDLSWFTKSLSDLQQTDMFQEVGHKDVSVVPSIPARHTGLFY